jgi:hypothetical protein
MPPRTGQGSWSWLPSRNILSAARLIELASLTSVCLAVSAASLVCIEALLEGAVCLASLQFITAMSHGHYRNEDDITNLSQFAACRAYGLGMPVGMPVGRPPAAIVAA